MDTEPISELKLNSSNGQGSIIIITLIKNNNVPVLKVEHRDTLQVNTGTTKTFLDDSGAEVKLSTDSQDNLIVIKE